MACIFNFLWNMGFLNHKGLVRKLKQSFKNTYKNLLHYIFFCKKYLLQRI